MGGLPTKRTVNGFAVSPADPKVMYAATRDGLFQSTDAGKSWRPMGTDLRNVAAVAINPKQSAEVYAATEDGVLYRTADGGSTWAVSR